MKKLIALLLLPLLILHAAAAIPQQEASVELLEGEYDVEIPMDWTLDDLVNYYIRTYHLNEENFAISLYLPMTQERAAFNETAMLFAASTYKLPLNMYYYEQQQAGVYTDNSIVGGTTLKNAHFQSIVYSNNEISHAMLYGIGSFYLYKLAMLEHYGNMALEELELDYWADNYYCTKFMCNTLQYLYEHSDSFEELIDYMKQAMPGQYLQTYAGEVEVAHKYGVFYDPKTSHNDVGILYTDEPVLVAIYTYGFHDNGIDGEELIGRIAKALIRYQEKNQALAEQRRIEEEEAERASIEAEEARLEQESVAASEAAAAAEEAAQKESEAERVRLEQEAASESESAAASEEAEQLLIQQQEQARTTKTVLAVGGIAVGAVLLALAKVLSRKKMKVK